MSEDKNFEKSLENKNEDGVHNEKRSKPRKLSRPKIDKDAPIKNESAEAKISSERAANDPRNK